MWLPWGWIWERNAFLFYFPGWRPFLLSYYFRGALTGLGLVNLWVGVSDAWYFRENLALLDRTERPSAPSNALNAGTAPGPSPTVKS